MADITEVVKLLAQMDRYKATHRLEFYKPYPKQKEFHNARGKGSDKPAHQRLLLGGNQIGKCNTISTEIETDKGRKKLSEIWGKDVNVLTYPNNEPRKVVKWVRKPPEECFRITMSDGSWVEVPRGHVILTSQGWLSISQILPFLPRSSSHVPYLLRSVHADALRWSGTLRGWITRYLDYFRLCGGQLLSGQDNVQVFSPLPSGVQGRTLIWFCVDDLVNKCTNIAQRVFFRLSSLCGDYQTSGQSFASSSQADLNMSQPISQIHQESRQSSSSGCPENEALGTSQGQQSFLLASCSPIIVNGNSIISCISVGTHTLYDMEVEERHNYIAAGLVHHNTFSGAMEAAIHLTGLYPDWWEGVRFPYPIDLMVGSNTNETCRDIVQRELFGNPMDDKALGTGTIPIDCIGKTHRKAGVPNAIDSAMVKHVTGGWSRVYLRAYEQGFKKFMGIRLDVGWLDEEPPEEIWSQFIRAGLAKKGSILYITMTPEEGMTKVVSQFVNNLAPGQSITQAGWDDAPHFTPEVKEQKLMAFPAHEREMRSKGVPLMGAGLVFETPETDIKVEPFEIPRHWPRINGIDFGWDHPFAAGSIAWDRENDCIYVTNVYRASKEIPIVQAQAILSWGDWIPVAWPHDGLNTEKGTGIQLKQQYIDAGLNMLPWKATNPPQAGQIEGEGGNSVEASIMDMVEREMTGRFKVFSNCGDYFAERRMYHRDTNGKLVKLQDDLLSAVRYAVMMVRHARTISVRPRKIVTQRGATNWS